MNSATPTTRNPAPLPFTFKEAAKLPWLFVSSLLEPFTCRDAQAFYARQITCIKQDGLHGYLWNIGKKACGWAKERPVDALVLTGSALLNHVDLKQGGAVVYALVKTVTVYKDVKSAYLIAPSILSLLPKRLLTPIVCSSVTVCFLAALPTVSGHDWGSLADARSYYRGSPCAENPWKALMTPVTKCLESGGSLDECRVHLPQTTVNDLYVFTRHPSSDKTLDPVSIVKVNEKGDFCFYLALSKTSQFTKTCFTSLSDPNSRTIERVTSMSIEKLHEGLKPGQSVVHVGMQLLSSQARGNSCGSFDTREQAYELGDTPVCLLTSVKSGGEVSQLCWNPSKPESMILKKLDGGISLEQDGDKPVSLFIKNPKKLGLETGPEKTPEAPCQEKAKGFSLLQALTWWWTQTTPCELPDAEKDL